MTSRKEKIEALKRQLILHPSYLNIIEELEKDLNKLKQLEDIEKELEIDLRVYHKLMDILYCGEPNIVYIKDKDMVIQLRILEIDYCKKKIIFYNGKNYDDEYIYGFSQYGEDWALTKEELENDK